MKKNLPLFFYHNKTMLENIPSAVLIRAIKNVAEKPERKKILRFSATVKSAIIKKTGPAGRKLEVENTKKKCRPLRGRPTPPSAVTAHLCREQTTSCCACIVSVFQEILSLTCQVV